MTQALAELVANALHVPAVFVVARGPGVPSGALLGEHDRKHGAALDPVVLAEILANAHDDKIVISLIRLLLGDEHPIEHTVARDRDGAIVGVIAVRMRNHTTRLSWVRTTLTRAASSLAGWLAVGASWSWPPQSLIEALEEPALAHEGGMVIVANRALAEMLGREPADIVGAPVARIAQRLTLLRMCTLVIGGRPRAAMLFERRASRLHSSVRDVVDMVLGQHYAFIRQTARVSFERRHDVVALVAPRALEELVELALLDTTAIFTRQATANEIRISVYRDEASAIIDIVASGAITQSPAIEHQHIGSIICSSRTRSLGGQFLLDVSRPDSRTLRITLPGEL